MGTVLGIVGLLVILGVLLGHTARAHETRQRTRYIDQQIAEGRAMWGSKEQRAVRGTAADRGAGPRA
jgi:hypothetical protein